MTRPAGFGKAAQRAVQRARNRFRGASPFDRAIHGVEGMISIAEARLLQRLAGQVRDGCIVEVGSYRGRSTVALALGAPAATPVYAVEPHEAFVGVLGGVFGPEDRAAFFRAMLRTGCYAKVRLVNLSSREAAAGWHRPVELLWIDGDHSEEGVCSDFAAWRPHLTRNAAIAFDDATDPALGPSRLIQTLTDAEYHVIEQVGKVVVLRKRPGRD